LEGFDIFLSTKSTKSTKTGDTGELSVPQVSTHRWGKSVGKKTQ